MPAEQPGSVLLGLLVAGGLMSVAPLGITRAVLPAYTPVTHWGPVQASRGVEWEMSWVMTTPTGSGPSRGIEGVTADNDGHLYATAATSRAMAKWSARP